MRAANVRLAHLRGGVPGEMGLVGLETLQNQDIFSAHRFLWKCVVGVKLATVKETVGSLAAAWYAARAIIDCPLGCHRNFYDPGNQTSLVT